MYVDGKIGLQQDCDSCQESDPEGQVLWVEIHDAGDGPFLRIKTGKNGWSFNNPVVMYTILNRILKSAEDINKTEDK